MDSVWSYFLSHRILGNPDWVRSIPMVPMEKPMKRQRPPMPSLSTRVQVAERQLSAFPVPMAFYREMHFKGLGRRLKAILAGLGFEKPELHHSPALILRPYHPQRKDIAARYEPNANDPDSLVYLDAPDHQQRTTGRKPGAERTITTKGSDIGLKSKFARLEGRVKPKRKAPIKSRGFAKGPKRKMQSRGFR